MTLQKDDTVMVVMPDKLHGGTEPFCQPGVVAFGRVIHDSALRTATGLTFHSVKIYQWTHFGTATTGPSKFSEFNIDSRYLRLVAVPGAQDYP